MATTVFSQIQPPLSEVTLAVVRELGFVQMTPVQAATIPAFLTNKDVCIEAVTGSGKTLAFLIPIVEILLRNIETLKMKRHDVGALVVAPTRELANQIFEVCSIFMKHHTWLRCGLFVGGVPISENLNSFETDGAHIVIGTPGRILDMSNRSEFFSFKKLEVLVLDEADTLLDLGFREDINRILSSLPKQRRTGLFSATQTKEVKELVRAGLRNPVRITVRVEKKKIQPTETLSSSSSQPQNPPDSSSSSESSSSSSSSSSIPTQQITPSSLSNLYTLCPYESRPSLLASFLRSHANQKTLVFCNTCACVDYYSSLFHELKSVLLLSPPPLPPPTSIESLPIRFLPPSSSSSSPSSPPLLTIIPSSLTVVGFHGKMVPKKRSALFSKFISSSSGVMFTSDVAARGLDLPDVDWVVQMTAPKDPAFFIHRVGRTARAGREGGGLLMLSEEEESYVSFMRMKGVPLREKRVEDWVREEEVKEEKEEEKEENEKKNEMREKEKGEGGGGDIGGEMTTLKKKKNKKNKSSTDSESTSIPTPPTPTPSPLSPPPTPPPLYSIHTLSLCLSSLDRSLLESSSTAFMSFLRSYKEHHCSYIFRFDQLDLGSVARGYALLRLPKIPETCSLSHPVKDFQNSKIDTGCIKYKHEEKEKARLKKREEVNRVREKEKEEKEKLREKLKKKRERKDGDEGGEEQEDEEEEEKEEKKLSYFESKLKQKEQQEEDQKGQKRQRKKQLSYCQKMQGEWEEMAEEEALYRRMKKGSISREEYEKYLLRVREEGEGQGERGGGEEEGESEGDEGGEEDDDNDNDEEREGERDDDDDDSDEEDDDDDDKPNKKKQKSSSSSASSSLSSSSSSWNGNRNGVPFASSLGARGKNNNNNNNNNKSSKGKHGKKGGRGGGGGGRGADGGRGGGGRNGRGGGGGGGGDGGGGGKTDWRKGKWGGGKGGGGGGGGGKKGGGNKEVKSARSRIANF